jgi:hypothetical protein
MLLLPIGAAPTPAPLGWVSMAQVNPDQHFGPTTPLVGPFFLLEAAGRQPRHGDSRRAYGAAFVGMAEAAASRQLRRYGIGKVAGT